VSNWKTISSPKRLTVIAGPCVIEDRKLCMAIAKKLVPICADLGVDYVFKASYDKANRTSGASFRGPGIDEGLAILAEVREKFGVPVLTDIHNEDQARHAAKFVDILQIPAFLCRQTDLLQAAVETGKIVNVKKGQFLSPQEMSEVVKKAQSFGAKQLMLTERGTTFGYNNLVSDMRSIPILKRNGFPVIFDATHSVQMPGGAGDRSSGQSEFAPLLARCAVTAGADGVFVETHPTPSKALSDGPNMVPLKDMKALIASLVRLRGALS
jgi:2-dehydro-3-deoxyphosphooctonate aldolase (KDO 8-P synthase)